MQASSRPDEPARAPALGALLALFAASALPAQGGAQDPRVLAKALRSAHEQYAQAKRDISTEREAWRKGKQTLETQVEVIRTEVSAFEARIAEARESIVTAEKKTGELKQEKASLEQVSGLLEERITALEERTKALLARVPEALADSVQLISQRLPDNDQEREEISLSVRYQNVIGVLNPIDKWNREVKVLDEQRDLPNGTTVSVTVIYVGLAQAYYVGGKGPDGAPNVAGTGTSSEEGWRWTPQNDLAADVATAVSVYRNEQLARLVQLPVSIL
ncbi:MAG: DUF3450 family protein [Planctomycetota bacterium]